MAAGVDAPREVRRNTVILAGCLALGWSVVQLLSTVGAPVLAELTGKSSLAGLAPGLYLASWAVSTLATGRYMDARGRGAGIRLGFLVGATGCVLAFVGIRERWLVSYLMGLVLAGAGGGAVNLARAGAADMYPPERRARGISFVLVGAAVGAIVGPLAFIPLLARSGSDLNVLWPPVAAAALVMFAGAGLTLAIRIDPIDIGRMSGAGGVGAPPAQVRPVRSMIRLPVVRAALLAAVVAQIVMSSTMGTISLVLHDHGHGWPAAALTLSAHFLGMFGLVLVVGRVVDRIGRERAVIVGLVVLAAGVLTLLSNVEIYTVAPAMFVIGVGWNLAFVAATAMLADATEPAERARLLGFSDFLALGTAAIGASLAGIVLGSLGLGALVAFGATITVFLAVALAVREPRGDLRRGVIRLTEPEARC